MRWVIPPASPAATRVLRMASRIEVLPWSTWPRTVTIGGRGTSLVGSSLATEKSSSREVVTTSPAPPEDSTATTSSLLTGSTVNPNSSDTISAVEKSMTWLMVARIFDAISFLMTSTGLTPSPSVAGAFDAFGFRVSIAPPARGTAGGVHRRRAAAVADHADEGCLAGLLAAGDAGADPHPAETLRVWATRPTSREVVTSPVRH